tara:strand:+ start:9578 stop:10090 length:513 start_codon:yes stop_codon:yes gene_type:complete
MKKTINIYSRLSEVKKEIGAISKDSTNPFFKSKYFDINGLLKHVEPLLDKNGLLLLQPIVDGLVYSQIIDVETGDKVESSMLMSTLSDPQKMGSMITYYRRYTLQSLLGLQAEDDDANAASKATKPKSDKKWVNKGDKIWNAAIDKGVKVAELKKHYSISKDNELAYPYR